MGQGAVDGAVWGVVAVTLTALGVVASVVAYRRRGARSGTRWLAATLLVPAAYLTKTLQMLARVVDAVVGWAASFVWNPLVWVGLVLGGLSVLLFLISARLPARDRSGDRAGSRAGARAEAPSGARTETAPGAPPGVDAGAARRRRDRAEPAIVDDDLADIEALLKRRGIS